SRGSIAVRDEPMYSASAASISLAQRSAARSILTVGFLRFGGVARRVAKLAQLCFTDRVLGEHLELAFHLIELLRPAAHQANSLFEERQRLFERQLGRLQTLDDSFEVGQPLFELHRSTSPILCVRIGPPGSRSSSIAGSIRASPTRAAKCKCGPVARPVMPTWPIV